jgi:uncharacterized membrane protein
MRFTRRVSGDERKTEWPWILVIGIAILVFEVAGLVAGGQSDPTRRIVGLVVGLLLTAVGAFLMWRKRGTPGR